jgi:hypothetical protein
MDVYRKTTRLARQFEKDYPPELAQRLRWWGRALGIDRVRLLRMMGMSARQASQAKDRALQDILRDSEWEQKAWVLEGNLVRLLSLFGFDQHALAERIHLPVVPPESEEPSRVSRRQGEVVSLRSTPRGADADLLLKRMAQGGPDSLSDLLSVLVVTPNGAGESEGP